MSPVWKHPSPNHRGGCHAQAAAVALARIGGGNSGGLSGSGAGWRDALRSTPGPIRNVWLLLFVPFLTLAPQWTGPLDWTWLGHPVAGERFLYVPGFAVWSFCIWWAGRRTEPERNFCQTALGACVLALLTAWISFERGSDGWLAYQGPIGLAQLCIALQLAAWARAAGIERPGTIILACCATAEFLIFLAVQVTGWDPACVVGLGLTCIQGPFVTLATTMAGIIGLSLWCSWLGWKIGGGGA